VDFFLLVYLLLNKKIMNKFIISESEKQRILEMHQNATSRQYLMEEDSSSVPTLYSSVAAALNKELQFRQKNNPNQTGIKGMVFGYGKKGVGPEGEGHDIKHYLTYETAPATGTKGTLEGSETTSKEYAMANGASYPVSKLKAYLRNLPSEKKSLKSVTFNSAGAIAAADNWLKQYQPTQKESDLTRIVKRVINERRYLMEGMDPRIDTLLNNIVTQINSKITEINTSSKTKIPNVSFKEVPDGDTSVSYDFYMGQSNIGRLPYKYLLNNWSSFESKLYNLFKYSTNTSLSLVLKANGLGNNMLEFSNAATGVVNKILQGFQWDGKPTQN
jgi:hypothetical protein